MAAGLVGAALFYGDGVITPAISVLSAVEGLKVATPLFDALCHADLAGPAGRPVPGAAPRHGGGRRPVRPGHAGVVRGPGAARRLGDRAAAARPPRAQPALRVSRAVATRRGAASSCSGAVFLAVTGAETLYADMGHFGRTRAAPRLARARVPGAAAELFRAGRPAARRPGGARKPVLPPGARMGPLPAGRTGLDRDDHRLAGGDLRRLLDHPPGDPARLSAAARGAPHLRDRDRPGLCAAHQLRPAGRGHHPGARLPVLGQSGRRLRHRGQRHDGDHHRARLPLHAQPGLEPGPRGAGIRRLRSRRSDLPQRQPAEDRRGRLVPDRRRGAGLRGHGDMVARPPAACRAARPRRDAAGASSSRRSTRSSRRGCRARRSS